MSGPHQKSAMKLEAAEWRERLSERVRHDDLCQCRKSVEGPTYGGQKSCTLCGKFVSGVAAPRGRSYTVTTRRV